MMRTGYGAGFIVLLGLAGIGCSGPQDECVGGIDPSSCEGEDAVRDSDSDVLVLGTARQAVVGGSAVTTANNTIQPYVSVVRLTPFPLPQGMDACTGLKISSGTGDPPVDRFLTAAHCFDNWVGGITEIQITNGLNPGSDPGKTHRLQKVYIHPTYRLRMLGFSNPAATLFGSTYDVALFDAFSRTTPNGIPAIGAIHTEFISNGNNARLTGYGSGTKRSGTNTAAAIPGDDSFWEEGPASLTHIYWPGSPVRGEPGDSGAPLFSAIGPGSAWEVIGVLAGPFSSNDSMFGRTAGIRRWVQRPDLVPGATVAQAGRLINAESAKCMTMFNADPDRFATSVSCYSIPSDSISDAQHFGLLAGSAGGALPRFLIRSGISAAGSNDLCLQPSATSPAEVQQKACNAAVSNQNWEFVLDGNDMPGIGSLLDNVSVYRLRNVGTGTCMQPVSTIQTERIRMQTCNDVTRNGQKWIFSR